MSARIREDDGGLHGLYALPRIVSFTLIDSVTVMSCDFYIIEAQQYTPSSVPESRRTVLI